MEEKVFSHSSQRRQDIFSKVNGHEEFHSTLIPTKNLIVLLIKILTKLQT